MVAAATAHARLAYSRRLVAAGLDDLDPTLGDPRTNIDQEHELRHVIQFLVADQDAHPDDVPDLLEELAAPTDEGLAHHLAEQAEVTATAGRTVRRLVPEDDLREYRRVFGAA